MMEQSFEILRRVFKACTDWTTSLIVATDSLNILLAAFSLCVVIALLFIPMRGHSVANWVDEYKIGKVNTVKRNSYKQKSKKSKS